MDLRLHTVCYSFTKNGSMSHISKRLSQAQVVTILTKYEEKKVSIEHTCISLGLKRARFFKLLKRFRADKAEFSLSSLRTGTKRISAEAEEHIRKELEKEKELIDNPSMPIRWYNYSAVQDVLKEEHKVDVSVPTIIDRAKKLGFYIPKVERTRHERIVSTDFIGELVQHDSSHHLFSPFMDDKLNPNR